MPPLAYPKQQTIQELIELVRLITLAHEYDINNNEPECPSPEKIKVFEEAKKSLQDKISELAKIATTTE